jgi:hypothetical protein
MWLGVGMEVEEEIQDGGEGGFNVLFERPLGLRRKSMVEGTAGARIMASWPAPEKMERASKPQRAAA